MAGWPVANGHRPLAGQHHPTKEKVYRACVLEVSVYLYEVILALGLSRILEPL